MCAPNAPPRSRQPAFVGTPSPVAAAPGAKGGAIAPVPVTPTTPGTTPTPRTFTLDQTSVPGGPTVSGTPAAPTPTHNPWASSTPGDPTHPGTSPFPFNTPVSTGTPTDHNPWASSTPGNGTTPGFGPSATTSPGGNVPGGKNYQWMTDWLADLGQRRPDLAGQRVNVFDPQFGFKFGDDGSWGGPLPDEWRNTLAGRTGFTGIRDGLFYGMGRDLVGGTGLGGTLDHRNLDSIGRGGTMRDALGTQGWAGTVGGTVNPNAPLYGAPPPPPSQGTPDPAPTAPPPVVPVTPPVDSFGGDPSRISTTSPVPQWTPEGGSKVTPSPVAPTTDPVGNPQLEGGTAAPLPTQAYVAPQPKFYAQPQQAGTPRNAVAAAMARRFKPQLWM